MHTADVLQHAKNIVAAKFPSACLIPQPDAGRYYVTANELAERLAERLAGGAK
ncbi:hypothetical protein [Dechloromonas hortensis]|uniref:hypothetical protein n=1 Tax=Dechloromonas hortensis TaxID=337779 RepID=UPI001290C5C0|nr:hypothetical protein [Dechloromonas hortensis]